MGDGQAVQSSHYDWQVIAAGHRDTQDPDFTNWNYENGGNFCVAIPIPLEESKNKSLDQKDFWKSFIEF